MCIIRYGGGMLWKPTAGGRNPSDTAGVVPAAGAWYGAGSGHPS